MDGSEMATSTLRLIASSWPGRPGRGSARAPGHTPPGPGGAPVAAARGSDQSTPASLSARKRISPLGSATSVDPVAPCRFHCAGNLASAVAAGSGVGSEGYQAASTLPKASAPPMASAHPSNRRRPFIAGRRLCRTSCAEVLPPIVGAVKKAHNNKIATIRRPGQSTGQMPRCGNESPLACGSVGGHDSRASGPGAVGGPTMAWLTARPSDASECNDCRRAPLPCPCSSGSRRWAGG